MVTTEVMSYRITINGNTHVINHSTVGSVTILNGDVIVDGVQIAKGLSGVVEIKWEGPVANLQTDANVTCGSVTGDVRASGNVTANNVHGDVKAGGNVTCGIVEGNVRAGGNVSCRR